MKKFATILTLGLLASCAAPTQNIDMNNDQGAAVMALDHRDFTKAADTMVQSLMTSNALTNKPGGERYVVAISDVLNDTMQRIDTDQLVRKVRRDMLNSGKCIITTAVSGKGEEDKMNTQARELRGNAEFNQATVQEKGQLVAPELSLNGKIFQRNIRLDNGDQQVEYYFSLTLTQLKTGLAIWEDEVVMGKRGSGKSVTW